MTVVSPPKRKKWKPRYEIGDEVVSKAVGSKPAFMGIVVCRGYRGRTYHVQDGNGDQWVRDERELKPCQNEEMAA